MTRPLPSGRVTFVFTDVEGSTRILHELGADAYSEVLRAHREVVRRTCAEEGGVEVDTQGDAFFLAFADAAAAVRAALKMTDQLAAGPTSLRIGVHTGSPLVTGDGYIGEDVHLGARIASSAHGGQVVCSSATREALPDTIEALDLGEHRLKDIEHAVAIFQLGEGEFPPLRTISNTNLPRPADTFLGRGRELGNISALIGSGRRLVTLLGPGGSGKTRLALEVAASLIGTFKAGVFWVDLSSVRDPAAVVPAIAATLGTEDDLAAFIGERQMLLVLDNLEQVIEVAPRIGQLVAAGPNLVVIVTSRERLRVRGEVAVEVPPLDRDDAGRLFADRSGLERSPDTDELCSRLEHLPLAVELAAARARALTPRQILERLSSRLDLLKGGRDADPRQRTLRATIDWSHELLGADEQRLFRRFAVFADGASLEAVEKVCDAELDTLESLIDKSLLRRDDGRFGMLETVREYAAERLATEAEADELPRRHAAWVSGLIASNLPRLESSGSDEVVRSLSRELPNLQAAFAWMVDTGDAAGATQFLDSAARFIGAHLSRSRLGLTMCDAVLAMPGLTDAERARIRHREGTFALWLSDRDHAVKAWTEAAALAERAGDAAREGHVLNNLALVATDPEDAIALMEVAIERLTEGGDERAVAMSRWNLVGLKVRSGDADMDEVVAATSEVLEWAARAGDYRLMSQTELEMGDFALLRGDPAEALRRGERVLRLAEPRGHTIMVLLAECLRARASVRLARRSDAITFLARAMELLGQADLEADDEIVGTALTSAIEVLGAVGAAQLAGRLERSRQAIAEHMGTLPVFERAHADWLARTGVVAANDGEAMDVTSALALVRESLDGMA